MVSKKFSCVVGLCKFGCEGGRGRGACGIWGGFFVVLKKDQREFLIGILIDKF